MLRVSLVAVVSLILVCAVKAQSTIPWTPVVDTGLVRTAITVPSEFTSLGLDPSRHYVNLPQGWSASVYHAGSSLNKARFLAWGPDSVLYVANMNRSNILALPDDDNNGVADLAVVAAQTSAYCGEVKFYRDTMYTAAVDGIVKHWRSTGQGMVFDQKTTVVDKSSQSNQTGGNHKTRSLVLDTISKRMYLSVGSAGNADRESSRALIEEYGWDGSGRRVYADGIRNAVGLVLHPRTGALWANNNGSDLQGNDVPPEWVDIVRDNGFYGYPIAYHMGNWFNFSAPGYGDLLPITAQDSVKVSSMVPPAALVWAHCAPMQMEWASDQFPTPWANGLFMVMRGSWNRSPVSGAKVVFFSFDDDSDTIANAMHEFCTGFITDSANADTRWARPVGIALAADGSVYVSIDDIKQCILKLTPPTTVSVNELESSAYQVNVRPNPARGSMNIEANVDGAYYRVIDISGRVHLQGQIVQGEAKLDTRGFPPGLYVVSVTSPEFHRSTFVTIER